MKHRKSCKTIVCCSKKKKESSKKRDWHSVAIEPMMPRTYDASERSKLRSFEGELLYKKENSNENLF